VSDGFIIMALFEATKTVIFGLNGIVYLDVAREEAGIVFDALWTIY
jgi:hypothetical protein